MAPTAGGLTIVIPARNEARRLPATLRSVTEQLHQNGGPDDRIIVVDNGSTDGTAGVAASLAGPIPVEVVDCRVPGKGWAVRTGVLAARTATVGFLDADGATDLAALAGVRAALADGAPIVIGVRDHGSSIVLDRAPLRRWGGFAFRRWVAWHLNEQYDTQCGFKFFRTDVAQSLLAPLACGGWAFDVELLARAQRAGIPVQQVPVRWTHQEGSRFRVGIDGIAAFGEARRAARTGARSARRGPAVVGEWEPLAS